MQEALKRWGVGVTLCLFFVGYFIVAHQVHPTIFQFRYNPYAFLSLVAFLANVILLGIVLRVRIKVDATYWYIFFLTTLTVWAGGEFLQRLSATREGALFWSTLISVAWVILPVSLLVFVITYIRKEGWLRNPALYYLLTLSPLAIIYLNLSSGAFIPFTEAQLDMRAWGFNSGVETYFPFFMIWFFSLYITAIVLLYRHMRAARQENEKKQALIFFIGTTVPFVIGSITDGVLPIFGITLYPMAVTLTTLNAVLITYAILKYGLLVFNPISLASNILETMQEILIVVSPKYTIEYTNARAQELLGQTDEELRGLRLETVFPGTYAALKRELLANLHHQRFAHIEKSELTTRAGTVIPVSISAARATNELGEVQGYILSMTDITRLETSLYDLQGKVAHIRHQNRDLVELGKQLEMEKASVSRQVAERTRELSKSRAQLMASINSLEMGFILINTHLEVILMNGSTTMLLSTLQAKSAASHVSAKEDTLLDIEQKFGGKLSLHEPAKQCIEEGHGLEIKNVLVGGAFFHFYFSPIILDKKVIGVVILVQDITESTVIERSKDEFFSIASHELRTPLTAIIGYTALIKSLYADKVGDKRLTHMLEGIAEGGNRMNRIVREFLDMSRLEQGKLTFNVEPLDLREIIQEVFQELAPLAKEKGVKLLLHHPHEVLPPAEGDRDRVKEILINLVGNALKFTERGQIVISAEVHPDHLQLRVHDTGQGIPLENQKLLFRKFQQAGTSLIARDASNGTGLGLYISHLMAEGMGGTICLESSAPGHGSTFSFTLKLA